MQLETAIRRIEWRFFTSFKNIYVNDDDIQAVRKLLDFVQSERDQRALDNIVFSNLYVAHLNYLLKHYRTAINDPIPFKKLHYTITRPLDLNIQELVDTLNILEQNKILDSCGFKGITHPNLHQPNKKAEAVKRLKCLLQVDGNLKKIYGQAWEFKEVKLGIEKQIKYVLDGY